MNARAEQEGSSETEPQKHDDERRAPEPSARAAADPADGRPAPGDTTAADASPGDDDGEAPMAALRPTVIAIFSTAIALTVASAFLFGTRATVAVGVGGLLATLNFALFIRLVAAFVSQKGNAAPWAVLAGVKLLGLFAFVYIILKRGDLPPLALAIGYGSLPIGISLGSLFKPKPAPRPR